MKNAFDVLQAVGSIFKSLLSSQESVKCVVDDDRHILSKCTAHILQNLDIQHPVGHLLNSAVQAHHERYGCGTKTLVTMAAFWAEAMEQLTMQGLPSHLIVRFFHEAVDESIQNLLSAGDTISLHSLSISRSQETSRNELLDCEEEEDLRWYFDDGKIPAEPKIPSEATLSINNSCDGLLHETSLNPKPEASIPPSYQSSPLARDDQRGSETLNDFNYTCDGAESSKGLSDDEFDDCFAGVACQIRGNRLEKLNGISPQRNTKSSKISPEALSVSNVHSNGASLSHQLRLSIGPESSELGTPSSWEQKLKHLLKSKAKQSHKELMNRSRHFTSISSVVDEFADLKSNPGRTLEFDGNSKVKDISISPQVDKSVDQGETMPSQENTEGYKPPCDPPTFLELASGLSHGAQQLMKLVCDVYQSQRSPRNQDESFELSRILTHCVIGPMNQYHVLKGVILHSSEDMLPLLRRSRRWNAMLINGDLSPSFKHRGFRQDLKSTTVLKSVDDESNHTVWLRGVISTLEELDVNVLLIKGNVHPALFDFCLSSDVAVFTCVPYKVLQAVGESSGVDLMVYALECTQEDVIRGLELTSVDDIPHCDQKLLKDSNSLIFASVPNALIQTMILSHPCEASVHMQEEQFWHCAKRLSNALDQKRMFSGGGVIEWKAYGFLMQKADALEQSDKPSDGFAAMIYRATANGFLKYSHAVSTNGALDGPRQGCIVFSDDRASHPSIYDAPSKAEAWQSACHVVCQVLLAENEVVVGIESRHMADL